MNGAIIIIKGIKIIKFKLSYSSGTSLKMLQNCMAHYSRRNGSETRKRCLLSISRTYNTYTYTSAEKESTAFPRLLLNYAESVLKLRKNKYASAIANGKDGRDAAMANGFVGNCYT